MRYGVARAGLWLCALSIAFGPSCVSVARKERTALGVEGGYSYVEDEGFSCGDEPPVQRHDQVGGTVELEHLGPGSHHYGGRVTALVGSLDDSNFLPDSSRDPYVLTGLGASTGWDFEYVGHEFGLNLVLAPQAVGETDSFLTGMPFYRLRIGAYTGLSAELQAGSRTGLLFDTRMLSAGLRAGESWLELHMGAAVGARLMVNQERGSPALLFGTRETLDAMFYADGEVALDPCWRIRVGLQLGQQFPTVTLGASREL